MEVNFFLQIAPFLEKVIPLFVFLYLGMEIVDDLFVLKFAVRVAPAPVFIEPEYRPFFRDDYFRPLFLHHRLSIPFL